MARAGQVTSHGQAHDAQAQESDVARGVVVSYVFEPMVAMPDLR